MERDQLTESPKFLDASDLRAFFQNDGWEDRTAFHDLVNGKIITTDIWYDIFKVIYGGK